MKEINLICISSFLTFRYVVDKNLAWTNKYKPWWPSDNNSEQVSVETEDEIVNTIGNTISKKMKNLGILLSGGIDSAILASFLPKGSKAYTIRFIAHGAIDESKRSKLYAKQLKLDLKIIDVYWDDYLKYSQLLMNHKRSPLHAIEVAIYKACKVAKSDGLNQLIVGNGADSTFGGMDKLLSKDWEFEEFINRYTFLDPKIVLKNPIDMSYFFTPYRTKTGIDVQSFLKIIHGEGIIQTFCNAAISAGVELIAPYESVKYTRALNLQRIRKGESKYILRSIFSKLYPNLDIPEKIPFTRPMDKWLDNWKGPKHYVFKDNINLSVLTGDQKWLLYILDKFLFLIES